MKKTLHYCAWILGLFLIIHSAALAQSNTVTGTVLSESDNTPLPGVTVVIKGKSLGTVTDADGKFTIEAEPNDVLLFSFVGMKSMEQPVGSIKDFTIRMADDISSLEEVVVVGYGSQKKANLTGAVAPVDMKALESRPITDVGRGLQGTTPGLTVRIPSGEVGSDPLLRIRGQIGSIYGGSAPLILLDNVQIPSIQLVNPDDIESISVLKDAASASIYGAKAAFGVILITTKKGAKRESVTVSYNGNLSFQNISKKMEMGTIDAMEYSLLATERAGGDNTGAFWKVTREGYERALEWQENYGGSVKPNDPMLYGRDWYIDANDRKIGLRMYDPYDYMVREWAPTQIHNLSVSGLSGKTNYNMSFGVTDQSGMNKASKEDDFERYNGSIQMGTQVNNWLKFNTGAIFSKRKKDYGYATNSTTADPWYYLYRWAATYPMSTEDGDPIRSPASEFAAANTAFQETNYTSLNGGFTLEPVKNLIVKFDYTHTNNEYLTKRPGTRFTARNSWTAAVAKYDEGGNRIYVNGAGQVVPSTDPEAVPAYELSYDTYTTPGTNPDHIYQYAENEKQNTINLFATYDLNLDGNQSFRFMMGMNQVGLEGIYNSSYKTELVDITNPQFPFAIGTPNADGGEYWESQLGFFGRINYNFREKYLLEANLRYDGSSKFPDDLIWRWFPSFSAGWRVNSESFMEWSKTWLDELKVRGSWGSIGDQSVRNDIYVPTMAGANTNWIIGNARLYRFGTPGAVSQNVTWQNIVTLDFGVDARFLNGALGLSFDWFQRDTKDMIVPEEGIPVTFGTTGARSNLGDLRTTGVELQLDYVHNFNNGLQLNFVATFADATTTITKYGTSQNIYDNYVGRKVGEIWGYETDRLYQADDFLYDGSGNLVTVVVDGRTINQLANDNAPTQERLQSGDFRFGPGDVKFRDLNGDGVINNGSNQLDDHGDLKVIGNSTPRYEYGFRAGANFKGFDFNIFFQGVGKRELWGSGALAIPGYNTADGAMAQAIAGDFWREDRTDAFYPRPWNMANANSGNNIQVQTRYLLDMSYLRIKNITFGYSLPNALIQKAKFNKLRVYGSLENFFTFDKLNGLPIDPEVIAGYSDWDRVNNNYNSSRLGVGIPAFKSVSMGLQLSF